MSNFSTLNYIFECEYDYSDIPKSAELIVASFFWKHVAKRIHQVDDFTYDDIAAVKFHRELNNYVMMFNPYEFALSLYEVNKDKYLDSEVLEQLKLCNDNNDWSEEGISAWKELIVDNEDIYVNVVSVLFHEMLHIVWNHLIRVRQVGDISIWNLATDYAINQRCPFTDDYAEILITYKNSLFMQNITRAYLEDDSNLNYIKKMCSLYNVCPNETITDHEQSIYTDNVVQMYQEFVHQKIKNKSSEFYYDMIMDAATEVDEDLENTTHKEWVSDSDEDSEDESKTPSETNGESSDNPSAEEVRQKEKTKRIVSEALEEFGIDMTDPKSFDDIDRIVGLDIMKSSLIQEYNRKSTKNWRQVLNKYVTKCLSPQKMSYTMSRESRRIEGLFPGQKRDTSLEVVIAIDVSMSITQSDFDDFLSQIVKIGRSCGIRRVRYIQVHSIVVYDEMVDIRNIKNIPIVSTGGTRMLSLYNRLQATKNKKLLILFTDGQIDWVQPDKWKFNSLLFLCRDTSDMVKEYIGSMGHKYISQDEE